MSMDPHFPPQHDHHEEYEPTQAELVQGKMKTTSERGVHKLHLPDGTVRTIAKIKGEQLGPTLRKDQAEFLFRLVRAGLRTPTFVQEMRDRSVKQVNIHLERTQAAKREKPAEPAAQAQAPQGEGDHPVEAPHEHLMAKAKFVKQEAHGKEQGPTEVRFEVTHAQLMIQGVQHAEKEIHQRLAHAEAIGGIKERGQDLPQDKVQREKQQQGQGGGGDQGGQDAGGGSGSGGGGGGGQRERRPSEGALAGREVAEAAEGVGSGREFSELYEGADQPQEAQSIIELRASRVSVPGPEAIANPHLEGELEEQEIPPVVELHRLSVEQQGPIAEQPVPVVDEEFEPQVVAQLSPEQLTVQFGQLNGQIQQLSERYHQTQKIAEKLTTGVLGRQFSITSAQQKKGKR